VNRKIDNQVVMSGQAVERSTFRSMEIVMSANLHASSGVVNPDWKSATVGI
jgi:hypothetical protein